MTTGQAESNRRHVLIAGAALATAAVAGKAAAQAPSVLGRAGGFFCHIRLHSHLPRYAARQRALS